MLAREVGLEGMSLGALATTMKMSKSGLFAHFKSKQALQLDVLRSTIVRFVEGVVDPAAGEPRGEPAVRATFGRHLQWIRSNNGSCLFMALSHEYDDRPGPVRDLLERSQHDWHRTIARIARGAVKQGHFRQDLDLMQFAYEWVGIAMAFQQTHKLLASIHADRMAQSAFEALLARSRAAPSH